MILATTGHRKWGSFDPNPLQAWAQCRLREELVRLAPEQCLSGMAIGWDQWFVEACIELGIPFTAVVPFAGQESTWPKLAQVHYSALLARAAEVKIVCGGGYAPWKMQKRNEWMVDRGNHLLAGWNGSLGGTAYCYEYALSKGFVVPNTITRIDPRDFRG